MKIVAIEEHFLSPDVRASWAASSAGQDDSGSLHLGEMETRLEELSEARISRMDESGVDMQVLSLTSPGLHNLEPAEGVSLARRTNDLIAATVAGRPDRFDGFATIPASAPGEAAAELERCVRELGMKGGMLFGRTQDKNLDHLDFLPIFETAAHLRVPLFIHPQTPSRAVREAYYSGFSPEVDLAFATFGLGWHYDCGIQFLRLALAGVFDRFPDLQIILGHWGEVVLFYTERLKAFSRIAKLERSVVDTMRENLYVTPSGMFSQSNFHHAVEIVGVDRVLFSADYPYQYRPGGGPKHFIEQLPIGQDEKEKIAHGNWDRLTHAIRR
ncbi:amidohydrolase [Capsulimonas corticalis]|uniref:Amidohydrolase n=1 Tax=Capsulimonas corticalis TaxID=2219043 RepID=A0A402CZB7_9BACT|nr:amidohydrolase family protein [Capsulimonas corticalis]BDI29496.1 amidohydrolase [Capsulimonas corticalis]